MKRPDRTDDPVGAAYDTHLARIEGSTEFAALMHEVACAYAIEDLTEKDARTEAVPEDVREFAKRLVVDVLTCAHGEAASPRAIAAMHALMRDAVERKNREGAGWWAHLTRLFRRTTGELPEDPAMRIGMGGYPEGFPPRVKDQVGYVLGNLRLNCPELGERLRTLSEDRMASLEIALGIIASKWEAPGRRLSSWTMASLVADALGLPMQDDPRVKRTR
jgi:hypothetical protein